MQNYYNRSNIHAQRQIIAALFPETAEEVVGLVKIASRYKIPLYPISKGNNYGYGGASPIIDSCVVVDLSRMNRITSMDSRLGLITVEPGVTTGQVESFLEKEGLPFLTPVIGIGLHASLIGNALEKGRSSTPIIDRISSLMSLEAVLADGTVYRSPFLNGIGPRSFFKWGVGPYIDGLFAQSNFGIVTSATFALAPLPDYVLAFYFVLNDSEDIPKIIDIARRNLQVLGDIFSHFSIQTSERIINRELKKKDPAVPLLKKWVVSGYLRGDRKVVHAAKRRLKRDFYYNAYRPLFFDGKSLDRLSKFSNYLPTFPSWETTRLLVPKLKSLLNTANGKTFIFSTRGLKQGILMMSVLLPMVGESAMTFVRGAEKICRENGHEFIATVTNFSAHCLLSNTLLTFDPKDVHQLKKVDICYAQFQDLSKSSGGRIYRVPVDRMAMSMDFDEDFWRVTQKIKHALDPENIIAPGRYSELEK